MAARSGRFSASDLCSTDKTHLCLPYDIAYAQLVTTLIASDARHRFYKLLDDAARTHEPVLITGIHSNAVLVSEEDWNALQETIYLLSIPGMRKSIRQGMEVPIEECDEQS
jgi:antitoxin YefM